MGVMSVLLVAILIYVASIVAVPWLVIRIPRDYLLQEPPVSTEWAHHHPAIRLSLNVAKNLIAYMVIAAGVLMLFLPGQGVLTIIAGLLLADFPGKHRLIRWTLRRPAVLRSVNWLRVRAHREPLLT